jgi:hypothetical protein
MHDRDTPAATRRMPAFCFHRSRNKRPAFVPGGSHQRGEGKLALLSAGQKSKAAANRAVNAAMQLRQMR